jgi:hypothetical protein
MRDLYMSFARLFFVGSKYDQDVRYSVRAIKQRFIQKMNAHNIIFNMSTHESISLSEHVIALLNDIPFALKKLPIPGSSANALRRTDDVREIERYLQEYYEHHTRFDNVSLTLKSTARPMQFAPALDRMPDISKHDDLTSIKFYEIQGGQYDAQKCLARGINFLGYARTANVLHMPHSRRIARIVRATQDACAEATRVEIDLRDNGGGDLEAFIDAFSPLIGRGLISYYDGSNRPEYAYFATRLRRFRP